MMATHPNQLTSPVTHDQPSSLNSDRDVLAQRAVELAAELLHTANALQSAEEREQAQRIAHMMADAAGKELTIALVDQAFRSHRPARVADQLAYLLARYGAPGYMDWWERAALRLGNVMGHYVPSLIVPPIIARLRQETRTVILPAETEELERYLEGRRQAGVRLNLNLLGEAILGEGEAERRLNAYMELLARDNVEYISVKVSSICSQLNMAAYRHTLEGVKERLRALYRQAMAHTYIHPDGRATHKFVNLDMEEYRDLHLTVDAFRQVLDEPEFLGLPAGLALQAYLPDSHPIQRELTEWAMERRRRGGAAIKVRIVKGANLAMERVDAAIHGWPQAPYASKKEVDANFKRMVVYGCQADRAAAVHLGIGSHNLFDMAYALCLREANGLEAEVEFEMLEGMANHQARAVQQEAGGLLLYAPVVNRDDFHSAIAYLVRRLDENTAPENFLHDSFALEPESEAWVRQRDRFLEACHAVEEISTGPRRTQDRRTEQPVAHVGEPFANEPDTDWSLPANQEWVRGIEERWRSRALDPIPLQIGGDFLMPEQGAYGIDPSRPGEIAYRYALVDDAFVDRALDVAVQAQKAWAARSGPARSRLLLDVAAELAGRRGDLIGAMLRDAAKTVAEADPEISEAIDFARYYAHSLDLGEALEGCWLEPLGVVTVAPPWNFPLSIPAGGVLAALMAGNAVILKPAPETVLTGWELAKALWAAGIPKEVCQFVPARDDDVGKRLITDPRVAGVILTGSIETARMFLEWRPELRLFAETSGKNSLIITSMADRDQAIKDLVHSAFGHNGQKCSAASLAICEAEVYDDPVFRRQLRDAVRSLPAGSAWELSSRITPLTQPASEKLLRALTTLDPGEEWLLQPGLLGTGEGGKSQLWSPGIKLGVQPDSFFHHTECFGPVLGLMRAADVDEAIDLANAVEFGLTGGIHTLDAREVELYKQRIEVGNVYVNRPITGAIVRRQPFGGWKASSIGPGAKAGGPNYVRQLGMWVEDALPMATDQPEPDVEALLQLCLWHLADRSAGSVLRASAGSYAWAWRNHFSLEHDPSQVLGEVNIFRYAPCKGLLMRVDAGADPVQVVQVLLAAATCHVRLSLSLAQGAADHWPWLAALDGMQTVLEDDAGLAARVEANSNDGTQGLSRPAYEQIRALGSVSTALRQAANGALIHIADAPVLANGRLELRHYLREQAVSRTVHRYGNLAYSAS